MLNLGCPCRGKVQHVGKSHLEVVFGENKLVHLDVTQHKTVRVSVWYKMTGGKKHLFCNAVVRPQVYEDKQSTIMVDHHVPGPLSPEVFDGAFCKGRFETREQEKQHPKNKQPDRGIEHFTPSILTDGANAKTPSFGP